MTDVTSVVVNDGELAVDDDFTFTAAGRLRRVGYYGYYPYWGYAPALITVTYSHGYEELPDDVKLVILSLCARTWSNPGNERSESIGSYSHSFSSTLVDRGSSLYLTDDERAVLSRYRNPVVA